MNVDLKEKSKSIFDYSFIKYYEHGKDTSKGCKTCKTFIVFELGGVRIRK